MAKKVKVTPKKKIAAKTASKKTAAKAPPAKKKGKSGIRYAAPLPKRKGVGKLFGQLQKGGDEVA